MILVFSYHYCKVADLSQKKAQLGVELAAIIEWGVTTTYLLEGDGPLVMGANEKIELSGPQSVLGTFLMSMLLLGDCVVVLIRVYC